VGVWDIDGKGHVLLVLRLLNVMLGYLKGIPADRHRRVLVRDGRTATIGNVDLQSGRFDIAVLMKVVVSTHVVLVIFFLGNFHLEFKFATEDDTKAVRAWRLINARESGTITPFVKLAAEGIAFSFAGPQFSACEESMATWSMDERNAGGDDRWFGWAADLREVGEKAGQFKETSV
jgi:hypothetical protein